MKNRKVKNKIPKKVNGITTITLGDVVKSDETVRKWMKIFAAQFRNLYKLPEFSEEGVKALEALILKLRDLHFASDVSPFTLQFTQMAISYFGECLIKETGGEWVRYNDTDQDDLIAIKKPGDKYLFPASKTTKFINNGMAESIFLMYYFSKHSELSFEDLEWDENGECLINIPEGEVRITKFPVLQ